MALKATEFEAGNVHEQYSGEATRRKVAASGALAGAAAGSAGLGTAALQGYRHAGRPQAQLGLKAVAATHKNPMVRSLAETTARRGAQVAAKPRLAIAGILGGTAVAGGAGVVSRFRHNEEAGISQGIGRIKAGARYEHDQNRAVGKSMMAGASTASSLYALPEVKRAAAWTLKNRKPVTIGASIVGSAGGLAYGVRQNKNRAKSVGQLRQAAGVNKAGSALHNAGRWAAALGVGGVAGGGATYGATKDKREANASVVGGLAGQGAYQGHNYALKHKAQRTTKDSGISNSQQDKHLKPVKREHGAYTAEMYRRYPEALPAHKTHRYLGWAARGRTGQAVGTAATVVGAAATAHAFKPSEKVGKASEYGRRDRNLSATRVSEAGLGGFLFAHGASHARAVGPMTAYGARLAEKDGRQEVRAAIEAATAMANATRLATDRGATQLRRLKRVSSLVDKVPANLRPATAITVGALLVQHARPLHNERFTPESRF